jgi:hypothetical protein
VNFSHIPNFEILGCDTPLAWPAASRRQPLGTKEHTVGFPGPQIGCLARSHGPACGEVKRCRERWSSPVLRAVLVREGVAVVGSDMWVDGATMASGGSCGWMATLTVPRAAPSRRAPLGPTHRGEKAAVGAGIGEAVRAEQRKGWHGLLAAETRVAGQQRTIVRSSNRGHKREGVRTVWPGRSNWQARSAWSLSWQPMHTLENGRWGRA